MSDVASHPIADACRDCLNRIERGIMRRCGLDETSLMIRDGADGDVYEIGRCLVRALRCNGIPAAIRDGCTYADLAEFRGKLLGILGSPGDWGHGSDIGAALSELCRMNFAPAKETT